MAFSFNKLIPGFLDFSQPNIPKMEDNAKHLSHSILPVRFSRIKQDVLTWRESVDEAERPYNPFRVQMQKIYNDTILDGHVKACTERRKDLTLLRDWHFCDKSGNVNEELTYLFDKPWFNRFMSHSLDALFFGYSLIELGDVVDSAFPKLKVIKRWNVSPDRYVVANVIYNLSGIPFLEEPQKDWHIYISTPNDIGTSDCGYGAFYEVALYQIFLRNITGFNGDFLELFGQPIRVGKTNKIEESERAEFYDALQNMGSAGFIMLDAIGDEIDLIESSNVGNSYKAYADFESRLQKLISKILLGHGDALDSTSGKLGATQGEDNPIKEALEDRQSKDGYFITDVINSELLPRLRKLGFNIQNDVKFEFKNDHEIHENNERIADISVKVKQAGLQVDKAWFEENTNIKLSEVVEPAPQAPAVSAKQKIQNLYK
jgi:phage gp29-like protein